MKVYLSEPDMAYFFFPEYKRVKKIGFLSSKKKILYFARRGEKLGPLDTRMRTLFSDYVIVTDYSSHEVDMSIDTREEYLQAVQHFRGPRVTVEIKKKSSFLSDVDFYQFIKMSLVVRRWYTEVFGIQEKVYRLFEAAVRSKKDFLKLYVDLRQTYAAEQIFASMLTFIQRIQSYSDQKESLSDFYRMVVKSAQNQRLKIKPALMRTISLPRDIPKENRMMGFYLSLKG